jgi:hypothetical protein
MRIQRFLDRLRHQDWIGITIEFVIVVAGVFLGMQVSNWNEERADNARAQAYLQRIHDDLTADVAAINQRDRFLAQVRGYAGFALAYAERGELHDNSSWKTLLAFYHAGQMYPNLIIDATYREMTSAGDLRLIRDERLNGALAGYYASGGDGALSHLIGQVPAYRETIRGLVPSDIQAYIWTSCYRELPNLEQQLIDCPSPISEARAGQVLRSIVAEPRALQELRFWNTQMTVVITASAAQRDRAQRVSDEVENTRLGGH